MGESGNEFPLIAPSHHPARLRKDAGLGLRCLHDVLGSAAFSPFIRVGSGNNTKAMEKTWYYTLTTTDKSGNYFEFCRRRHPGDAPVDKYHWVYGGGSDRAFTSHEVPEAMEAAFVLLGEAEAAPRIEVTLLPYPA